MLVMVDRITKYGPFITLSHPFSAYTVAKIFLDNIYKLHGMPRSMVSDRDRVFTCGFWQGLLKLLGIELHLNSVYRPQTKKLNQCL